MIRIPEGHWLRRIWESPTVATWASLGVRTLELGLILPLILRLFNPAEITVWYLIASTLALQMMIESGFSTTFIRVIAYGTGQRSAPVAGAPESESPRAPETRSSDGLAKPPLAESAAARRSSATAAWAALGGIYRKLAVATWVLTASLGTLAMWRPIGQLADAESGWWAWALVVVTSPFVVGGNHYVVFLLGNDRVALQRRFEAASLIVLISLEVVMLATGGGLLSLVLARQAWALANVGLNRWLCIRTGDLPGAETGPPEKEEVRAVLEAVLPSAWRSSLGVSMATGVVEASGFIYAQIGDAPEVASYLVAMKLMQGVLQFSAAPFYSRLPRLAQLYASGEKTSLIKTARRSMALALWTFVLAFATLSVLGPFVLELVGSQVSFAPPILWILLGWSFFVERYGAMHLQLFSSTNKILWHIANGGSGSIYLLVAFLLFRELGVLAFPCANLAGHLGFYTWFSVRLSNRAFGLSFWRFERTVLLPTLAAMLLLTLALAR